MLQIISGKFFGDGEINEQESEAVLFANYSWFPNNAIHSKVVDLEATTYSRSISPYVVRYTNRYEKQSDTDVLVLPHATLAVEQTRLLASFYFQAIFNEDRAYVELLTRQAPRHSTDDALPSQFIPRFFNPHIRGNNAEVTGFEAFIDDVIGLERDRFLLLLSCLETFFDALESVSANFDLAYSMFVYLLEALSQHLGEYEPTWEDFDPDLKPKLDRQFAELDDAVTDDIRAILLNGRQLKLTKRFVDGISSLVENTFFEVEAHPVRHALAKSDLEQALKNLYASRSQFVHSLRRVRKQLKVGQIVKDADVFRWENQPYFTLSGLVRLTRHVLNSFLRCSPKVEREDYNWRRELPGIISFEMAPEYWIWKAAGLRPLHAHKKFNGFMSFLTSKLSESQFAFPTLKDLLAEIEKVFDDCTPDQSASFFAVYATYSAMIVAEGKPNSADEFVKRHEARILKNCTVQMMSALLVLGQEYHWEAEECATVFESYSRRKYKPTAISLPVRFEVALQLEIARCFKKKGDTNAFQSWNQRAFHDAAGDEELQRRISASIEHGQPIAGREVLAGEDAKRRVEPTITVWEFENQPSTIAGGSALRFRFGQPFLVRWSTDAWATQADSYAAMRGENHVFAVQIVVPEEGVSAVEFTFFWITCQKWEGRNFNVRIEKQRG